MSLINTQVPAFKTTAFVHRGGKGEFIEVTEANFKGKWSVVIFMPAAFTFNCPTEIEDAADNYAEFQKAGAEVYIVTTDTHFSHKIWHETSAAVGKAQFPLVGDPTHQLTNAFGVHIAEEGLALRGTFVIPTKLPVMSPRRCANSKPHSSRQPTPAKYALPSGKKGPRR